MKLTKTMLAAVVLMMAGVPIAHAGTKIMASAPADVATPSTQMMHCDITNIGTEPASVTIDIMDYSGTVVMGPHMTTIAPNTGDSLGPSATGVWCRFSVTGSTKYLRGMAIYDNGAEYSISIPAY